MRQFPLRLSILLATGFLCLIQQVKSQQSPATDKPNTGTHLYSQDTPSMQLFFNPANLAKLFEVPIEIRDEDHASEDDDFTSGIFVGINVTDDMEKSLHECAGGDTPGAFRIGLRYMLRKTEENHGTMFAGDFVAVSKVHNSEEFANNYYGLVGRTGLDFITEGDGATEMPTELSEVENLFLTNPSKSIGIMIGVLGGASLTNVYPTVGNTGAENDFKHRVEGPVSLLGGGKFQALPQSKEGGGADGPRIDEIFGVYGESAFNPDDLGVSNDVVGTSVTVAYGGKFRAGIVKERNTNTSDSALIDSAYGLQSQVVLGDQELTSGGQGVINNAYAVHAWINDPGDNIGNAYSLYAIGNAEIGRDTDDDGVIDVPILTVDVGSGTVIVPNDAYNATTWNGSNEVPTKDAIRDKMESIISSGSPGGSNGQVQFNDSGAFGGDPGLTYNSATDALTVAGALSAATINTGDGNFEIGQNLRNTDAVTFATVNTGPGVTEVHLQNQNLRSTDSPTFANGTFTGNLTIDTTTLSVDATNNRVGVGTTTPDSGAKLHSYGSVMAASTASSNGGNRNSGYYAWTDEQFGMELAFKNNSWQTALFGRSTDAVGVSIGKYAGSTQSAYTPYLNVLNSGSVGIGTAAPNNYEQYSDDFVIYNSGNSGMTIASSSASANTQITFADGTGDTQKTIGGIQYNHANDFLSFWSFNENTLQSGSNTGGLMLLNKKGDLELFDNPNNAVAAYGNGYGSARLFVDGTGTNAVLYYRNGSGNADAVSPHRFQSYQPKEEDPVPFTIHSLNNFIGKSINIDHSGLLFAMEQMYRDYYQSDRQFIYVEDLPQDQIWNWEEYKTSQTLKIIRDYEDRYMQANPWIEIPLQEALETVPEIKKIEVAVTKTKYRVNFDTEQIEDYPVEQSEIQEIQTGNAVKRIKPDCRFDEDTGKCYRSCTRDDVVLSQAVLDEIKNLTLPQYVMSRLPKD